MWYASKDGKQVPLNVTDPNNEAAAWAAFQALLQQAGGDTAKAARTCAEVVAAYLADAEGRGLKPRTIQGYRWYLGQFLARFGTEPLATVAPERVEADSRRATWAPTTRNNYLGTVESCLRWAGLKVSLRKPAKESAGAGSVIPEPVFRRVLAHCQGDWYACISFLWHTGCRPCEASAATVEAVDWEAGVVRLRDHKTSHHGKGDRLIYLNDPAREVVQWQAEKYGSGLLFRSNAGGRLSQQAFVMKFQRLSRRVGRRVTAYGFRHSFCTRALAAGESDAIVAALVGHASTQMIHKHYAHADAMGRQLREAAQRIGQPKAG